MLESCFGPSSVHCLTFSVCKKKSHVLTFFKQDPRPNVRNNITDRFKYDDEHYYQTAV